MSLDDLEMSVNKIKEDQLPKIIRRRTWMRFLLTIMMFGSFGTILNLLFHPTLVLDEKFRDLLNIVIGTFLASFGKIIDFWFKGSHTEEENQKK
tara:strand:- start:48 stop:329 length:282 start_codon:yes stop_codon:yes gene_type:complete